MYRFWNTIIEPAFQILKPSTIVEIGVDAGKQTELVLAYCKMHGARLHAIDPSPTVDAQTWATEHTNHLISHRDISLNVLGGIQDIDAVLIDGDHNWYTVLHELLLLEKQAIRGGRFPVVFLHDTGWPYARRDLYYAPERIPDAYRKAYAEKGIQQDKGALAEFGGFNAPSKNAVEENTLQNGVLTAVEDFLEQSVLDLHCITIPGLHGLGLIAPMSLLHTLPAFSTFLNALQTGKHLQAHMAAMEYDRVEHLLAVKSAQESQALIRQQAHFQKQQLGQALADMQRENEWHRDAVSALTNDLERIRQSRSWRWTAPIRNLEAILRRTPSMVISLLGRFADIPATRKKVISVRQPVPLPEERSTHGLHATPYRFRQWLEETGYACIGWGKAVWVRMGSPFPRLVRLIRVRVFGYLWRVRPSPLRLSTQSTATHPVTIVIPVFNALDAVTACLESVLRETTAPHHRILVVNDASTDVRMKPYLQSLAARAPGRVEVLTLAQNGGFVQAANAGMRHAAGDDIVLLNSDTIVTTHWLETLRQTAYLHADTGSVTPLSNEASIYSVFQKTINNALQKGTLNELALSVTALSKQIHPQIPTGVGFCLFLRHEALQKTGLFDERFGRGYAEENDWCMRARAQGFRHYLDDACFIYHKGHVSMEAAGIHTDSPVVQENEALLQSLHPHYQTLVSGFLSSPVMSSIRAHTEGGVEPDGRKRLRIGFVLHQPIRQHSIGGTEFHVSDLVQEMRATADCFVIYPDRHDIVVMEEGRNGRDPQYFRYRKSGKTEADICHTFETILKDFRFDIVHIHHTRGLSFELLPLAKKHGTKVLYTVHDWLCVNEEPAHLCTKNEEMIDIAIFEKRRSALDAADIIIAPSQFVQKIVSNLPGMDATKIRVIEHGIVSGPPAAGLPLHEPLVCFFGATHIPYKGKSLITALVPLLEKRGIRSAFLGSDAYEWPELRHNTSVTFHGFYERSDVNARLHTIAPHLVCLLSLWPETFSYTLSEAWAAGIPAYVTPMGAQQERMLKHGGGRIAPSLDPEHIADDIASLLRSPEYQQILALTRSIRLPDVHDMGRAYTALYQAVSTSAETTAFSPVTLP